MYKEILLDVEKNIEESDAKFNTNICPDAKRCTINYSDEKFTICETYDTYRKLSKAIFVLESPHKSEFKDDGTPIAVAQGATGKNFDEAIINFLVLSQYHHKCFSPGYYEVWLINAVQYQVSLGIEPKNYRSILFQIAWHSFAKTNFSERLKELVKNDSNSVIFNACTKGNGALKKKSEKLIGDMKLSKDIVSKLKTSEKDINLNLLVQEAIEKCSLKSYKASHPYKWNRLIY